MNKEELLQICVDREFTPEEEKEILVSLLKLDCLDLLEVWESLWTLKFLEESPVFDIFYERMRAVHVVQTQRSKIEWYSTPEGDAWCRNLMKTPEEKEQEEIERLDKVLKRSIQKQVEKKRKGRIT